MIDFITYTDNLTGLRNWLQANYGSYPQISKDGMGAYWVNTQTMQPYSNGNHSVTMTRGGDSDLAFFQAAPVEILAQGVSGSDTCPHLQIAADPAKITKVDSARPLTPIPIYDADENLIENRVPSRNFGVFG